MKQAKREMKKAKEGNQSSGEKTRTKKDVLVMLRTPVERVRRPLRHVADPVVEICLSISAV